MNDTLDAVAAARSDSLGWAPTSTEIAVFLERLAGASPSGDDAARIDRISALERLKSAAAAQARETVAFKSSQLAEQRCAGLPAGRRGAGIGAQVALARRESAHRGGRLVGLADALAHELPHTMTALVNGEISEWRAVLVARETCCLAREHRVQVDRLLAAELPILSDRQVAAQARRHAYRLDPHAVVNRASRAEAERRVTIRPAPDTMALVSALLPAAQGVATYAALTRAADAARAAADERTRGQVMADTLVQRVTGQAPSRSDSDRSPTGGRRADPDGWRPDSGHLGRLRATPRAVHPPFASRPSIRDSSLAAASLHRAGHRSFDSGRHPTPGVRSRPSPPSDHP